MRANSPSPLHRACGALYHFFVAACGYWLGSSVGDCLHASVHDAALWGGQSVQEAAQQHCILH